MATALRYLAARQSGGSPIGFVLSSAARRPFCIAHRRPFSIAPRRLRPLVAVAEPTKAVTLDPRRRIEGLRCFSSSSTSSSLGDPSPNWSNRPPKETILLDGCDFEHWLVVVEPPDPNLTRDEIIDSYITTLAKVVGSKEDARFKIYSVSTKHYFAFGALVSEELSYKLKELPGVRWVLPDSYLDVRNKDYGGEPFIDGQAVPYDPKYHEEWVRNNARAMERNRRSDRPRSFDRSRNFERRNENMQNFRNQTPASPPMQQRLPSSPPSPPQNLGNQPPATSPMQQQPPPPPSHPLPRNIGNQPNPGPMASSPPNMGGPNHMPGPPPNLGGPSYMSNPSPVPPPMPGLQPPPRPGAPPYDAPNYGFQSQPPNYQNSPSSYPNQGFGIQGHGGGNSYANSMPHSSSTNPYQGPPPNYYQNSPPTYQQPPQNAYQPNPGAYQGGPSQGYKGNVDGNNPYQGRGGRSSSSNGNGDTYQGQDFGRQN